MRRQGSPSEIRRLATPLARTVDAAWQRMHWWIVLMAVLYALSGITVVRSDEIAVVQRWGRVIGATPALQEHGPGLLFALPRPIDRVVRVQARHISEETVVALDDQSGRDDTGYYATLDPLTQGYALTGDQNIVHTTMVARYRIRDVASWAFYGPRSEDILRVEVSAAMVRSLGEMGVDRVLSDGRKDLIAAATRRAQAGLDAANAGIELTSLEVTRLAPPAATSFEFEAVQSAFISADTKKKDAQAYAEMVVPQAQGRANVRVQAAEAETAANLAAANGDASAFAALEREYRENPGVVRERLYRDAIDRAMNVAKVRWVPPPVNGKYIGLRITLSSPAAGPTKAQAVQADEERENEEN
jgi:modulator of FtsH protease HflK